MMHTTSPLPKRADCVRRLSTLALETRISRAPRSSLHLGYLATQTAPWPELPRIGRLVQGPSSGLDHGLIRLPPTIPDGYATGPSLTITIRPPS